MAFLSSEGGDMHEVLSFAKDVSLHNLVVLVVMIPTSPRLSKTEFVGESYCSFTLGVFSKQKF